MRVNERAVTASGGAAVRRIKVFFIIGTLDVGGAETQLVELVSRLDRARFDPIVCSMKAGGALAAPLRSRGIRVEALGFIGMRQGPWRQFARAAFAGLRGIWRLWRLLKHERPDLLHGILIQGYVPGTFVGRLAGVPRIVSSRRSLGLFKEGKIVYLWLERIADRFTDLFIANSEAVRVDTLRREPVPASKIIVIHNGLDFARFDASQPAAELAAISGPRVIVVSNLLHYKGHECFLGAWQGVVRVVPGAVALLVGDGPLRGPLERRCQDLGITDSVRFLGLRHDVPALLAASDLYVHASREEG